MQNLLTCIQAFVLDSVGLLIRILKATEKDQTEDSVSLNDGKAAIADALGLLGIQILKAVNLEIQELANEELFGSAAPNLFGQGFEGKMKERAESLKLLNAA